jgi:DNA replication protein DnaC
MAMDSEFNNNQQSEASDTEKQSQNLSDEQMLSQFTASLAEEREHWGEILRTASPDNPSYKIAELRLARLKDETPETCLAKFKREQVYKAEQAKREAEAERKSIEDARTRIWWSYLETRGKRYQSCRFANFECTDEKQRLAVGAILRYRDNLKENLSNGKNLVLFGPSGTGKDHLMTAMVHASIGTTTVSTCQWQANEVAWTDGPSMFARVRDEMSNDVEGVGIVKRLKATWLLAVSDLVPPSGKLTDFQTEVIYMILDYRYNHVKPTFLSINVRNRAELDAGLGVAVAERLIDNAVTVSCDWPSYRKSDRGNK